MVVIIITVVVIIIIIIIVIIIVVIRNSCTVHVPTTPNSLHLGAHGPAHATSLALAAVADIRARLIHCLNRLGSTLTNSPVPLVASQHIRRTLVPLQVSQGLDERRVGRHSSLDKQSSPWW